MSASMDAIVSENIYSIKSDYQIRLENAGWEFRRNIPLVNDCIDYSSSRRNMRLLKEDLEDKFFPGEKVRLSRAYDERGNRIPSKLKTIAIYTKDK